MPESDQLNRAKVMLDRGKHLADAGQHTEAGSLDGWWGGHCSWNTRCAMPYVIMLPRRPMTHAFP
jgi:hypothetical protein